MMDNQSECCICMEKMTNTNISITRCKHKFHTSCLLEYGNKKCAICRQNIAYEQNFTIIVENEREYNFDVNPMERMSFVDGHLLSRNEMNLLLSKLFYVTSQIYVAVFLIYCLKILTTLLCLVIYNAHIWIGNVIFENV